MKLALPVRFVVFVWMLIGGIAPMCGQSAYTASWKAGLWGTTLNPATLATSPHKVALSIGSLDVHAQNNLFEANRLNVFGPQQLVGDLFGGLENLTFMTDVASGAYYPLSTPKWSARHETRAQLLGVQFRKVNPDLLERGLTRMTFGVRWERNELLMIDEVGAGLAEGYVEGFSSLGATELETDNFSVRKRSWDALALNYGVSLGKGKNLLHIVIGAKLLSAGSFLDFEAFGSKFSFATNDELVLQSDSVRYAYNPSLEGAFSSGGARRFDQFEYSFGVAGEIGLIYQVKNLSRTPALEFGVALKDVGLIQYWNLTDRTYLIPPTTQSYLPGHTLTSAAELTQVLTTVADTSLKRGELTQETLPLHVTLHAKARLWRSKWNLHIMGNFRQDWGQSTWQPWARATLTYESKRLSVFLPVSINPQAPRAIMRAWQPWMGCYVSVGDVLVLGSEDLLSNLYTSATRKGVRGSQVFLGLRIPFKSDY